MPKPNSAHRAVAGTAVGVAIASMTPKVGLLAIIHRLSAAQGERSSTYRTDSLTGRRWIGDNLFSACCARYFHGSPERFYRPEMDQDLAEFWVLQAVTTSPHFVITLKQLLISVNDKR